MLTFAYVPCAPQFPFGGDVSVILPMRSSAGTLLGAQNWAGSRPLSRFTVPLRRGALPGLSVRLFPMPLRAPGQSARNLRRLGLTLCAASLSVEESRLARRPPLKAARSGLYASERIHHWDWFEFERTRRHSNHGQQVFRVVVLRRNGTENPACHLRSFACIREDRTMLSVRLPDAQEDLSPPMT